jgi:hypothetical protein
MPARPDQRRRQCAAKKRERIVGDLSGYGEQFRTQRQQQTEHQRRQPVLHEVTSAGQERQDDAGHYQCGRGQPQRQNRLERRERSVQEQADEKVERRRVAKIIGAILPLAHVANNKRFLYLESWQPPAGFLQKSSV